LFEHLAILFQAFIAQQHPPDALCEGLVTRIFRKNKYLKSCYAYIPITVCSTIGKLLEELIYNENSTKCDHGDNQLGFSEGLGVQNDHATLLAIPEWHKKAKINLYLCAADISKAFDTILHSQAILSFFESGS